MIDNPMTEEKKERGCGYLAIKWAIFGFCWLLVALYHDETKTFWEDLGLSVLVFWLAMSSEFTDTLKWFFGGFVKFYYWGVRKLHPEDYKDDQTHIEKTVEVKNDDGVVVGIASLKIPKKHKGKSFRIKFEI